MRFEDTLLRLVDLPAIMAERAESIDSSNRTPAATRPHGELMRMIDLSTKPDVEAAVRDPADHFTAPMDIVTDARLTVAEKRRILESWACDAEQLSQAEAENMPGRDRPRLGEVSLALIELGKQS